MRVKHSFYVNAVIKIKFHAVTSWTHKRNIRGGDYYSRTSDLDCIGKVITPKQNGKDIIRTKIIVFRDAFQN